MSSEQDPGLPAYESGGVAPIEDKKVAPYNDAEHPTTTADSTQIASSSVPGGGFAESSETSATDHHNPSQLTEEQQRLEQERVEKLPSALFAIPFPPPASKEHVKDGAIPFLLYMPPRSVYKKPEQQADGKPGKEGLVKKVERKWQEEVKEGEDIKRGDNPDASRWQKMKGGAARAASAVIKFMPDTVIEALGRLPPGKKLGPIMVLYPETPYPQLPQGRKLTQDDMREQLDQLLMVTKKKANRNKYISALTLPVTATIDFFVVVPIFAFEINCAYFAGQVAGSRKVNSLTKKAKDGEEQVNYFHFVPSHAPSPPIHHADGEYTTDPSHTTEALATGTAAHPSQTNSTEPDPFQPILALLYALCHEKNKTDFPIGLHDDPEKASPASSPKVKVSDKFHLPMQTPLGLAVSGPDLVKGLIQRFKATVPPEVCERHVLDEDRVAEDLERCIRKGVKEYVKSV